MKFGSILRLLVIVSLLLTASCGGGNGETAQSSSLVSRFDADEYLTDDADNSSLTGTWLLTGSYRVEDTIDKSIDNVVFRQIVSVQQSEDGMVEIQDCFADIGGEDIDDINDNQIEWILDSPASVRLSVVNNLRLEGDIVQTFPSAEIVTSSTTATMVKIASQPTHIPGAIFDLGNVSMIVAGEAIENGELSFESPIFCFAEKQIESDSLEGAEEPGDLSLTELVINTNLHLDNRIYLEIQTGRTGSLSDGRSSVVDGVARSNSGSVRINYHTSSSPFVNEVLSSSVTYNANDTTAIRGSYTIDADDQSLGPLDIRGDFNILTQF